MMYPRAMIATVLTCSSFSQAQVFLEFQAQGTITNLLRQDELQAPFNSAQIGDQWSARYTFAADLAAGHTNPNSSLWFNPMLSVEFKIGTGDWVSMPLTEVEWPASSMAANYSTNDDALVFWLRDNRPEPILSRARYFIDLEGPPDSVYSTHPTNTSELAGLTAADFPDRRFFGQIIGGVNIRAEIRGTVDVFESVLTPAPGAWLGLGIGGMAFGSRRRR